MSLKIQIEHWYISGLYTDAETALKWLCNRADIDSQKIFVYGSSLGGAVSIKLCSDTKYMTSVAGLILENTFTSIPDVARGLFNMKALDFVPFICYKNQVSETDTVVSLIFVVL